MLREQYCEFMAAYAVARISAGPDDTNFTLMCCAWSPCGTYLAATGNLHVGFLWHWPLRKVPTPHNAISIRSLQVRFFAAAVAVEA